MVDVVSPREQWVAQVQLYYNATQTEDVDRDGVFLGAEQVLRGSVPTGGHIVGYTAVLLYGKAEIDQFHFGLVPVDHDVLGFDVAVDYAFLVDMVEPHAALEKNAFYLVFFQAVLLSLIQLQNIFRDILQDHECFFLMFGFLKLVQFNDVRMVHFLENLGLFYGNWNVVFHRLYRYDLLCLDVFGQVDRAEIPISDF